MKGLWKIRWALAVVLGLAALVAVGCGDDDENGDGGRELRKVTVMLDWTPNTNHSGLYVAKAKGWYEEEGLDVEIVEPTSGGVPQVIAAGRAQFGISVQEQVIPAREQGIPIVSIAAIIQHNTSSLASLAEDGITRPRDLEGKTYGGFGGALETQIIETLISCDGGDPSTVRFVEVGNVDYLIGMEQNQYDFVWLFDAWDVLRYREIEGRDINTLSFIDYTHCIPDWYTPVIVTSESLIEDEPEMVRAFMAATARGYEFAIENPEETAQILLDAVPELDPDLVRLSAEYLASRYVDEGRQWGLQDLEIWTGFEQFLREAGLTEAKIEVAAAFTNDFLPGQ
ncbi:MAG: ABC transporter substrate-binding protein [Dehalococcoidia bacterium]